MRESEAVAKELFDFRCKKNIEKGEVTDDPLVLQMDLDLSAVLEGLQSHDPLIRIKSLDKIGEHCETESIRFLGLVPKKTARWRRASHCESGSVSVFGSAAA